MHQGLRDTDLGLAQAAEVRLTGWAGTLWFAFLRSYKYRVIGPFGRLGEIRRTAL